MLAVDVSDVWERCRYCGSADDRLMVLEAGERACPRCAGSPLCDACGHPRREHAGVFDKAARLCRYLWHDHQSLTQVSCNCVGFVPITTSFRDAAFAVADDDESALRLA